MLLGLCALFALGAWMFVHGLGLIRVPEVLSPAEARRRAMAAEYADAVREWRRAILPRLLRLELNASVALALPNGSVWRAARPLHLVHAPSRSSRHDLSDTPDRLQYDAACFVSGGARSALRSTQRLSQPAQRLTRVALKRVTGAAGDGAREAWEDGALLPSLEAWASPLLANVTLHAALRAGGSAEVALEHRTAPPDSAGASGADALSSGAERWVRSRLALPPVALTRTRVRSAPSTAAAGFVSECERLSPPDSAGGAGGAGDRGAGAHGVACVLREALAHLCIAIDVGADGRVRASNATAWSAGTSLEPDDAAAATEGMPGAQRAAAALRAELGCGPTGTLPPAVLRAPMGALGASQYGPLAPARGPKRLPRADDPPPRLELGDTGVEVRLTADPRLVATRVTHGTATLGAPEPSTHAQGGVLVIAGPLLCLPLAVWIGRVLTARTGCGAYGAVSVDDMSEDGEGARFVPEEGLWIGGPPPRGQSFQQIDPEVARLVAMNQYIGSQKERTRLLLHD